MWKLRRSRNVGEDLAPLPTAGKVPAAPDLSPEDIDLIHGLWLELSEALPGDELRHSDVVTLALRHLQRQFEGPAKNGILDGVRKKHARQSDVRTGPATHKTGTTTLRIDTPLLKPFILIDLIIATMRTINVFDLIFVMTNGGPLFRTEVMPLFMYHQAFDMGYVGRGAAVATMILMICVVLTGAYLKLLRTEERA